MMHSKIIFSDGCNVIVIDITKSFKSYFLTLLIKNHLNESNDKIQPKMIWFYTYLSVVLCINTVYSVLR